jgi:hypothetical protein
MFILLLNVDFAVEQVHAHPSFPVERVDFAAEQVQAHPSFAVQQIHAHSLPVPTSSDASQAHAFQSLPVPSWRGRRIISGRRLVAHHDQEEEDQ